MGTFSIWHWVIVLVIVMLVFGTKKLGNIGGDLGKAIKGFKDGIKSDDEQQNNAQNQVSDKTQSVEGNTIDVEAKEKSKS
tara:strand:+ start:341 stop:580 length:240 start_codon:yes stop_codon:yes gene_type:complete